MVGSGFLGRLLERAKTAPTQTQSPNVINELTQIQQLALTYLKDVNTKIDKNDFKGALALSERFYTAYAQFTSHQKIYRKAGGQIYMEYRIFIQTIGPAYEAINGYINNSTNSSKKAHAIRLARQAQTTLAQQDVSVLASK